MFEQTPVNKGTDRPDGYGTGSMKYRKSNRLIGSMGRCSALGLKILAVGIRDAVPEADGSVCARISGQELRALFHRDSGSFYSQISDLIKPADESKPSILDFRIYVRNAQKRVIEGINVITNARFKNGELLLRFNPDIRGDICDLKGNYGTMNLETTIAMERSYSIRFYEIFKARMDRERALTKSQGPYTLVWEYAGLRQVLGIDHPGGMGAKDAERVEYPSYTSFRRYVLEKSMKEVNEKSDIHMEYGTIREGRGGAVTKIRFVLSRKEAKAGGTKKPAADRSCVEPSEEKQLEIMTKVADMLREENLTASEVRSVCKAAGYDIDRIRKAYELERNAKNVRSVPAWMVAAIRGDYRAPENCRALKDSRFNDFEQQAYDFEKLEKIALAHDCM